jgi:hypothetical protein
MKCNCGLTEAVDKFPKQVTHASSGGQTATLNCSQYAVYDGFLLATPNGILLDRRVPFR